MAGRRKFRGVQAEVSRGRCFALGIAMLAVVQGGCILDDVTDQQLATLPPPCLDGWVESQDGQRCIRPEQADAGQTDEADSGEPQDSPDMGVVEDDAGEVADSGVSEPQDCFDVNSGTPPIGTIPTTPVINEWAFRHVADLDDGLSTDYFEFFEIYGPPETDFSALTLVIVNSNTTNNIGLIIAAIPIGTTNRGGFWHSCDGWMNNTDRLPQSSSSMFLVRGFSAAEGVDLDDDDNGVLDSSPWTEILDQVAFEDGEAVADIFFATPVLTNDGFPGHTIVGGRSLASRAVDGQDSDAESDWRKGAFRGFGLPPVTTGTPNPTEAWLTPGAPNRIQ